MGSRVSACCVTRIYSQNRHRIVKSAKSHVIQDSSQKILREIYFWFCRQLIRQEKVVKLFISSKSSLNNVLARENVLKIPENWFSFLFHFSTRRREFIFSHLEFFFLFFWTRFHTELKAECSYHESLQTHYRQSHS